jgi:hypothetical protein
VVAELPAGIVRRRPITTTLRFVRWFADASDEMLVPNWLAIDDSVSPGRTTYVVGLVDALLVLA